MPSGVRYVISLDADTRLPRGTARRLIGKMAHPLNRPRVDAAHRRVTAGYAILQPRVTPALPIGRGGSAFQSVFSGPSGIDPYAFAVSDVYQDLFGEGSYSGKGIYDVAAFEASLRGRVAENSLLSHDLFEGIMPVAGSPPTSRWWRSIPHATTWRARGEHRWTRGDWQLLPWIFGRSGIPALGRWKMLDNLRRSLVAPASLLLLAIGWRGPGAGRVEPVRGRVHRAARAVATGTRPAAPRREHFGPPLPGLGAQGPGTGARDDRPATDPSRGSRVGPVGRRGSHTAATGTHPSGPPRVDHGGAIKDRGVDRPGGILRPHGRRRGAGGDGGRPRVHRRTHTWVALPFLVAWLLAPLVAQRVSLPAPENAAEPLTPADRSALRGMARETWSYFDTFVTDRQQMLPPDNFQEVPNPVIANRTSPTNIGLYLLSVVCARDFGWIGTADALGRLEATFTTLDKLERYRGHFYNWYDTRDLRPLDPRYYLQVDSGNLAAHLLTWKAALRELVGGAAAAATRVAGVTTNLKLASGVAAYGTRRGPAQPRCRRAMSTRLEALSAALRCGTTGVARATASH